MNSSVGGTIKMGVEEEGRWRDFDKFFRTLRDGRKITRHVKYKWRDFMRSYQGWAYKGLITEGAAVNQSWQKTAYQGGVSTGIRTGNYLRAIGNMKISMRGNAVTLKFSPGDLQRKSHKGGATLKKYLEYFEGGGPKQPPRPLWGPAFEKAGGKNKLYSMMLSSIKTTFNNRGLYNVKIRRI